MDEKQRHAAGMKVRREILGDAYVDRAVADTTDVTTEFQDLLTHYAWGRDLDPSPASTIAPVACWCSEPRLP